MAGKFSRPVFIALLALALPALQDAANAAMKTQTADSVTATPDASNRVYNSKNKGPVKIQDPPPSPPPTCIWRINKDGTRTRLCGAEIRKSLMGQ